MRRIFRGRRPRRTSRGASPLPSIAVLLVLWLTWLAPRPADAQPFDVAPGKHMASLREAASAEFIAAARFLGLGSDETVAGLYVAFDDDSTDVSSLVACDDDGDYVVVLSDALLALARSVADAEANDEVFGTYKLEQYARFLSETVVSAGTSWAGPVPPPPGFFDPRQARAANKLEVEFVRFREILASIVVHELIHLKSGAIVCSHPTATHERGDDEWTLGEREQALVLAREIYTPEGIRSADIATTAVLLEMGRTEIGSVAWLRTAQHLAPIAAGVDDTSKRMHPPRSEVALIDPPESTYLRFHGVRGREDVVRAAAIEWRRRHSTIPRQTGLTKSRVAPKTN
jgi:hypothetical protein